MDAKEKILNNLTKNPETGKYKLMVNSSLTKNAVCGRKAFFTGVVGISNKDKLEMVFGSAIHKFAELYESGTSFEVAAGLAWIGVLKPFIEDNPVGKYDKHKFLREYSFFIKTCEVVKGDLLHSEFFKNIEILSLGNDKIVESKFSFPWSGMENSVAEVWICGTVDMLCRDRSGGNLVLLDWKSTCTNDPKSYLSNYRLSGQLRFYDFAIRELIASHPHGSLAAYLNLSKSKSIFALISGIFLANNDDSPKIERSEMFSYDEVERAEYRYTLERFCTSYLTHFTHFHTHGMPPVREGILNGSCGNYFSCDFCSFCAEEKYQKGSNEKLEYLSTLYGDRIKPYNPLNYRE